jgi:F-type H+-transporting ATPase subunit delta
MTNRAAAARYARALFDVSLSESDPQAVEQELAAFVELVSGHDLLMKVLTNPAIPAPRKQALVTQLTARAGLSSAPAKLLALLAQRDRVVLLPDLLGEYRQRVLDHQKVVRAEVTTAVPLPTDRVAALGQAFEGVTGRRVLVTTSVDPAVIGGVVARLGSTVYDGSVRRHLERIREALTEGT